MKLQLWIINSFLALIFLLAFVISHFWEVEPPVVKIKELSLTPIEKKEETASFVSANWDKIYQNDVFGTYVKRAEEAEAVKPQLVTPPPVPTPAQVTTPPEPKMPSFVAPLNITLRGIIVTGDEQKSAAMIADEANKERMYYLGDKIKDAQIVKLARNRVVVVRANGQQETYYLIKDDLFMPSPDKWENIVKKINDQQYKIDPHAFKLEVDTLGNFIERVGLLGTAYSQGNPVGVKIGEVKDKDVATALGITQSDVILTINGISTAKAKDRMQIFDKISRMKLGDTITVKMLRAGNEVSVNYELDKFPRVSKAMASATGVSTAGAQPGGAENLPMNQMQERERNVREFSKRHGGNERDQRAVSDMRSKFLENLREKLRRARSRAR